MLKEYLCLRFCRREHATKWNSGLLLRSKSGDYDEVDAYRTQAEGATGSGLYWTDINMSSSRPWTIFSQEVALFVVI